jgi:hypothetical protein
VRAQLNRVKGYFDVGKKEGSKAGAGWGDSERQRILRRSDDLHRSLLGELAVFEAHDISGDPRSRMDRLYSAAYLPDEEATVLWRELTVKLQ